MLFAGSLVPHGSIANALVNQVLVNSLPNATWEYVPLKREKFESPIRQRRHTTVAVRREAP